MLFIQHPPDVRLENIGRVFSLSFNSCPPLDAVTDHGAVVFPGTSGAIAVAQELFCGRPVVPHCDVARPFIGVEVEPVLRVVHIAR